MQLDSEKGGEREGEMGRGREGGMCVCERERERENEKTREQIHFDYALKINKLFYCIHLTAQFRSNQTLIHGSYV